MPLTQDTDTLIDMSLYARTFEWRFAALWPVIGPLRGGLGQDELDTFSDLLALLEDAALDEVDRALRSALRNLDTEQHAAALSGVPWRGPNKPFSVRRFQRARECVIAAGPEAMSAVSAYPSLIADYDEAANVLFTPLRPDGLSRRVADELLVRGLVGRPRPPLSPIATRRRRWPSLGHRSYAFAPHDPDHVWLHVDSVVGGQWRRAVASAGGLVINRLGATPIAPIDEESLWSIALDLAPWGRRPAHVVADHGTLSVYASVESDPRGLPSEIARTLCQVVDGWIPAAQNTLDDLLAPSMACAEQDRVGNEWRETARPPNGGHGSNRPMLSVRQGDDDAGSYEQSSIARRDHDTRPAQGLR